METQTRSELVARSYRGEEDLQAICDLINMISDQEKLDDNRSLNDMRMEIDGPWTDIARDLRLWEDANGRLVGFGKLWIPKNDGKPLDSRLYFRVHPEFRASELAEEIIAWGSTTTSEVGRERGQTAKLMGFARDFEKYTRDVLQRNGFEVVRFFFKMARPLDEPIPEPQFPQGYTMRHANGSDEDIERWVEMFNLSFIDHWNHHPATVEDEKHFLTHPNYRREGSLSAIAPDGTFAAFCFCWIDPEDNTRNNRSDGWISVLGTRRGHRKIGLGKAMLLSGFNYLKSQAVAVAKLGVDAENPTGALRLYESVGFETVMTSVAYRKDL